LTLAGSNPRPFKQLQFLRGTADLYMDLTDPPPQMLAFMASLHAFYCDLLETWARTDVDALRRLLAFATPDEVDAAVRVWRRRTACQCRTCLCGLGRTRQIRDLGRLLSLAIEGGVVNAVYWSSLGIQDD